MPRQRHPVLPRVHRLRGRRRREGRSSSRRRSRRSSPRSMAEFTKDRYGVDVHEGRGADQHEVRRGHAGRSAARRPTRSRRRWTTSAARPTSRPSRSSTCRPASATPSSPSRSSSPPKPATRFSGVLCGRATWKDGIPVYGKQGADAFRKWLESEGVKNIEQRQRPPQGGASLVRVLRREVGRRAGSDGSEALSISVPCRLQRPSTPLDLAEAGVAGVRHADRVDAELRGARQRDRARRQARGRAGRALRRPADRRAAERAAGGAATA